MKRVSLVLATTLLATISFNFAQVRAEEAKDAAAVSNRPIIAPSAEACLEQVRKMAESFPKVAEQGKEAVTAIIPDPAEFEKKLPPINKVLEDKDAFNLKNYGGLSEAYMFKGEEEKALSLLKSVTEGAKTILPPEDNFLASVQGDFGLAYYLKDKHDEAEKYLSKCVAQIEKNYESRLANNLIASYLCMAIIKDKQGKTEDAKLYSKKLVVLALKQRQEQQVSEASKDAATEATKESTTEAAGVKKD